MTHRPGTAAGGTTAAPATEAKSGGPTPSREVSRHTVQAGESLGTIARRYGMTVGELAAANNISDPAKIFVGQSLIVAGGRGGAPRPTSTAGASKGPAPKPANGTGPVAQPVPASTGPTPAETAAATPSATSSGPRWRPWTPWRCSPRRAPGA